ncbi:unnamed protein product [Laminaria digitata]
MATLGDVLLLLIGRGPGRTEQELAKAIYGPGGWLLLQRGQFERRGEGGQVDPYRYYLPE